MPPAARISDAHVCPKVEPGPKPHVGGPVSAGEATVLIGFQPAARVGDAAVCIGPPDTVARGEPSVQIGFKDAARLGDATSHGGVLVAGCPTVVIGSSPQAEALRTDKPFAEDCDSANTPAAGGSSTQP
jgi:uncharacterized Zn-binding protein involved in type VI secretion